MKYPARFKGMWQNATSYFLQILALVSVIDYNDCKENEARGKAREYAVS